MSSSSAPATILAVLGAVIAVLAMLAGNVVMVGIGLVAVFGAGLLDVIAIRRIRS